ncbi:unnamed protein product [Calypogeia fissa]
MHRGFMRFMSSRNENEFESVETSRKATEQSSSTGENGFKSVDEVEKKSSQSAKQPIANLEPGLNSNDEEVEEEDDDARLEEAERDYLEALGKGEATDIDLEQLENLLGEAPAGDATVGTLYIKLGQEYDANGEGADQVLRCGQKALSIFQTKKEDVRLEVAMALHLIAIAYVRQEKYEASLPVLHEALELFESKGGEQSRAAKCAVRFLLGEALSGFGKADEALGHLRTAVKEQELLLGEDHVQIGKSYRKIAEVLANVMKHDEALPFAQKALQIHIKVHGEGSMDEAIDRRLLAVIHIGLENHEKALEQHVIVRKLLSGTEHGSQTVFVDISTADTEITLGKYDDAISSLETALSKVEKGSAMHGLALVNLAKVYERKKQPDVADKYAKEVVEILENKLLTNSDPLAVAEGYTELAALYEKIGQTESAIDMLRKAHAIYAPIPNQRNAVAGTQAQIGMLLFFTGRVEEAVPFLETAAENLEGAVGEQNFALAMVLNHLGVAKVELEILEDAVEHFERAKYIFDEVLGSDHDDTIAVARNLVNTYSLLDRLDDAIKYQKEVVKELEFKDEAKEMLEDARGHLEMLEDHRRSGKLVCQWQTEQREGFHLSQFQAVQELSCYLQQHSFPPSLSTPRK